MVVYINRLHNIIRDSHNSIDINDGLVYKCSYNAPGPEKRCSGRANLIDEDDGIWTMHVSALSDAEI